MRTEHYPDIKSRKPRITTTNDPEEDVKRRDLTINAIYYNIDTGEINDFVGGVADLGLDTGKIKLRTPDETKKTYMEDPLRLLRALRFHSRYPNSVLDPEIINSMSDVEIQEAYSNKVSPLRAGPEIMKMMTGDDPTASLRILFDSGLYKTVFKVPEMENINEQGIQMDQQTPWHKHNLMDHVLEVIKNINQISKDNGDDDYKRGLMNMAGMFHDFGKMAEGIQKPHPKNEGQMQYIGHETASHKMCDSILKSIGVGKDDRDVVNQIVKLHMRPHGADKWGPKGIGNFIRDTIMHGKDEEHKNLVEDVLRFNKADEMSSQPDKFDEDKWQQKYDKIMNFRNSPTGSFRGTVLNGRDIMSVFPNINPSTGYIKEVLDFVKAKQDEGVIDVSGDLEAARQEAFNQVSMISTDIINKYNGGRIMGCNWFKKIKVSQVPILEQTENVEDPEIKDGPNEAAPKYYVGMKVRDRRRAISQPQEFGTVDDIKGNEIKIIWSPKDKEKRREEIFNMIEDTEILSLIVSEV
jgi:CRISPR-associated endonuclease Cas3-HD